MKSRAFLGFLIFLIASVSSASTASCSLFAKREGPLEIRIIFGYKDARPARFVGDRHERLAFIEKLISPCRGDNLACGFVRDPLDSELFIKNIWADGNLHMIHAIVVNSSVGTDDEENRNDAYQVMKSAHAEDVFLSGLQSADVVLYNGHSRFGGGPDFEPPVLRKDGAVDPAAYSTHRNSYKRMLASLREGDLRLLGLYSCTSTQHFERGIRRVSHTKLVSSHSLMYYSDALKDSLETLNEVLHGQCTKSF